MKQYLKAILKEQTICEEFHLENTNVNNGCYKLDQKFQLQ